MQIGKEDEENMQSQEKDRDNTGCTFARLRHAGLKSNGRQPWVAYPEAVYVIDTFDSRRDTGGLGTGFLMWAIYYICC